MDSDSDQESASSLMAKYILANCGYEKASQSSISAFLKSIDPNGGTAMRDSLNYGSQLILKLNKLLQSVSYSGKWNFVHVILTDGADCSSKSTLEETIANMMIIGKLINVKSLKIIILGVGVGEKEAKELTLLAKAAGENGQYYNISSSDISSIFQKISVNLGLQQRQQIIGVANQTGTAFMVRNSVNPCLKIEITNYAVLFNLDISGSMSGAKWGSVCGSVSKLISQLGSNDLVAGIVFNDKPVLIAEMIKANAEKKKKEEEARRKKEAEENQDKNMDKSLEMLFLLMSLRK